MTVEQLVRLIAGGLVLLSIGLYYWGVGEPALWLAVFVGANLFQSGFTKFCLLAKILKRLGVPQAC